jgi:hypothetical protein
MDDDDFTRVRSETSRLDVAGVAILIALVVNAALWIAAIVALV